MHRSELPQRLREAWDRRDVYAFLRYWVALPASGRFQHPYAMAVYDALTELSDDEMTGAQRFWSDQREADQYKQALAAGYFD